MSSSSSSVPTVRVVRRLPFPAERVFEAWLDPVRAARWLFATEGGEMIRAEIDARVGGRWRFTERRAKEEVEHTGEYLIIDRPRRLVFTFGVPAASRDFDRVTVQLAPLPSGCELTLTHEMKPEWAAYTAKTHDGWTKIVDGLARTLDRDQANATHGRFGTPAEVRLERLLPGPIERVWDYLTDPAKRARWFAGGTIEPRVGGKAALFFRDANLAPKEAPPEHYKHVHDPGVTMEARVLRWEPPHALAYTFGDDPRSNVTFELSLRGKDVLLVITHRAFGEDLPQLPNYGSGWHTHVDMLVALLEPLPLPSFWSAHHALKAAYDQAFLAAERSTAS
jgi:uncharacterized protein YndB with AHSA1/START domain